MKKIILSILMLTGATTAVIIKPTTADAQISFNLNIGSGRGWMHSGFNANFCYFPAINAYYDVANSLYYYLYNGSWTSNQYLPDYYQGYNLSNLYQVPMNGSRPWRNNRSHYNNYRNYGNVGLPQGRQRVYNVPRNGGNRNFNGGNQGGNNNRPNGGGQNNNGGQPNGGGNRGNQQNNGNGGPSNNNNQGNNRQGNSQGNNQGNRGGGNNRSNN